MRNSGRTEREKCLGTTIRDCSRSRKNMILTCYFPNGSASFQLEGTADAFDLGCICASFCRYVTLDIVDRLEEKVPACRSSTDQRFRKVCLYFPYSSKTKLVCPLCSIRALETRSHGLALSQLVKVCDVFVARLKTIRAVVQE